MFFFAMEELKAVAMSRVEAYICDCCGKLFKEEAIVGVSRQDDAFDKLASFPTVPNPAKAFLHYSVECYREHVLIPASNLVDRKKEGEELYKAKVKELAFALRHKAVYNYNEKQRFKSGKKK